jgi:hypothetical protein
MTKFRVIVDMGDAGVSTVESEGNISIALKAAYAECKAKKQNPISVNVVQVPEADSGKWKASIPSRS